MSGAVASGLLRPELERLAADPVAEPDLLRWLEAMAETRPTPELTSVLRDLARGSRSPRIAAAAAIALLSVSDRPDDALAAIDLAISQSEVRTVLRAPIDRWPGWDESVAAAAAPLDQS